jgi:hypothetical protein
MSRWRHVRHPREREAVNAGHHEIDKKQIDVTIIFQYLQGIAVVGRLFDFEASSLERLAYRVARPVVIFDHQYP